MKLYHSLNHWATAFYLWIRKERGGTTNRSTCVDLHHEQEYLCGSAPRSRGGVQSATGHQRLLQHTVVFVGSFTYPLLNGVASLCGRHGEIPSVQDGMKWRWRRILRCGGGGRGTRSCSGRCGAKDAHRGRPGAGVSRRSPRRSRRAPAGGGRERGWRQSLRRIVAGGRPPSQRMHFKLEDYSPFRFRCLFNLKPFFIINDNLLLGTLNDK
jgi:hypothetical protein